MNIKIFNQVQQGFVKYLVYFEFFGFDKWIFEFWIFQQVMNISNENAIYITNMYFVYIMTQLKTLEHYGPSLNLIVNNVNMF